MAPPRKKHFASKSGNGKAVHHKPGTGPKDASTKPKPKAPPKSTPEKPIDPSTALADPYDPRAQIPFDLNSDNILLVGEGDLSFTHSLLATHCPPSVTATTYDPLATLETKYPSTLPENLAAIKDLDPDTTLLHGIDATQLSSTKALKTKRFDRIVFNFPHIGGKTKDVNRQVRANQELLVGFFGSALPLLTPGGTIIVTLFEGEPYTLWNVRDLARHKGLAVVRSFRFEAGLWPGYSHARTLGEVEGGGGWRGEEREARSYVFGRKEDGGGTGKRARDDSDED